MKDFDAEQTSLSHVSDASRVHQLNASGPVDAYVVHLTGALNPDCWINTISHNDMVLESARVYKDQGEIDELISKGLTVEAINIPVGEGRDKFLRKWLKAASKNKKGLSPLLLIPLAACGGGDNTSDSTVPTLSEAAALVNSTVDAVSFANGIKGTISDLVTSGSVSDDLTSVVGDDPDVTISVTDATSTVTAADLSAIGGSTTGTVTVANGQTITGTAAEATAALVTSGTKVVLGAASTVTVSDATAVATAAGLAGVTNATVGFTNGITGAVADLASSGSATSNLSAVAADDADVTISVTDSTGTVTAANLSAIGGSTTGTVTFANGQTITGTAAEVTAALVTSGTKVVLGAASTVTVSDATAVADAAALAGVTNATVGFTNGITGAVAGLVDSGSAHANLSAVAADDADVTVSVTDGTGTITATNLSAIGGATTGTVTVANGQTITGTAAEATAALVTSGTKVVLGAASTVTVSDATAVATAAALAGVTNATVGFTNGITGAVADLASSGSATSNLSAVAADDADVTISVTDSTGTVTAANLSAIVALRLVRSLLQTDRRLRVLLLRRQLLL